MLLCEGCSINSFGQTFSKKSKKKLNVLKHCSLNICSFIKNVVLCGYLFKNWASDLSVCTLFFALRRIGTHLVRCLLSQLSPVPAYCG